MTATRLPAKQIVVAAHDDGRLGYPSARFLLVGETAYPISFASWKQQTAAAAAVKGKLMPGVTLFGDCEVAVTVLTEGLTSRVTGYFVGTDMEIGHVDISCDQEIDLMKPSAWVDKLEDYYGPTLVYKQDENGKCRIMGDVRVFLIGHYGEPEDFCDRLEKVIEASSEGKVTTPVTCTEVEWTTNSQSGMRVVTFK